MPSSHKSPEYASYAEATLALVNNAGGLLSCKLAQHADTHHRRISRAESDVLLKTRRNKTQAILSSPLNPPTVAPAAPVAPLKSCLKRAGTHPTATKSVAINTARFSRQIHPLSSTSRFERIEPTFVGVPWHSFAISTRSSLSAATAHTTDLREELKARRQARALHTLSSPPVSLSPDWYLPASSAATLARARKVSERFHTSRQH